jgi:hypothetical protein
MCQGCLVSHCPDRGRVCLSAGSFLLNFRICANCQKHDQIKVGPVDRLENDETQVDSNGSITGDYEETIEYSHYCLHCDHEIARHFSSFMVTSPDQQPNTRVQEYLMQCELCGRGADHSYALNHVGKNNSGEIPPVQSSEPVRANISLRQIENLPQQTNQESDGEWED